MKRRVGAPVSLRSAVVVIRSATVSTGSVQGGHPERAATTPTEENDLRRRLAEPCDQDLDISLSGLRLIAVVVADDDQELLLRLVDGFGGRRVEKDWIEVRDLDIDLTVTVPDVFEGDFARLAARLEGWRDAGTLLQLCGAPGRMTTLIETTEIWVPLPRHWSPPSGKPALHKGHWPRWI